MRRMWCRATGLVLVNLVIAVPSVGWARSICISDAATVPRNAMPAGEERLLRTTEVERPDAADGMSEYLSFSGTASYVYNSYSGCGSRTHFMIGDALNLTYSAARGESPFERLTGHTRDDERFLDASLQSMIGDFGRIGYAASLYTVGRGDRPLGDRVAGTRVWFNSPDERLQASSEVAVSASAVTGETGTAQRHQLSMTVLESADTSLSTTFSFSSVEETFRARRSAAWPDRETLDATANLRAGRARLSLTFSNAQNNIDDDPDRATNIWRGISAHGGYQLDRGRILPDELQIYATRTERHELAEHGRESADPQDVYQAAGFALSWHDWLDGGVKQDAGGIGLAADIAAEWRGGDALESSLLVSRANARLSFDLDPSLAVPADLGLSAGVTSGETVDADFGGQMGFSADIDLLDLLFDLPSGNGGYMLGRFGSGARTVEDGIEMDYRGLLTVGVVF